MNIGIDIDGTIDAFPSLFQHLIAGFTAQGNHVYIITGSDSDQATDEDYDNKAGYLTSLGIPAESYYKLIVCPNPTAENKVIEIQKNGILLLIDNKVENVKAAKKACACFLVWNSREKDNEKRMAGDVITCPDGVDRPYVTHSDGSTVAVITPGGEAVTGTIQNGAFRPHATHPGAHRMWLDQPVP